MNPRETAILDRIDESETAEAVLCTAEVADCTCPDFCERDHEND